MYISLCVAVSFTRLLEAIVSDWIMKFKKMPHAKGENRKIANINSSISIVSIYNVIE